MVLNSLTTNMDLVPFWFVYLIWNHSELWLSKCEADLPWGASEDLKGGTVWEKINLKKKKNSPSSKTTHQVKERQLSNKRRKCDPDCLKFGFLWIGPDDALLSQSVICKATSERQYETRY